MSPAVGFVLQPEERFLELLDRAIHERVDYYEIAPETTWLVRAGRLEPNGFHRRFRELRAATGRPFVAHGVGFSPGTARPDRKRRARWLERLRADHAAFEFAWYTDHLGVTEVDGLELTLPAPVPMSAEAAAVVRAALAQMQGVVPDVGVENTAFLFHLGDPLDEPAFLASILEAPRTHLLLDLHNVHATALNVGFDPWDYVRALPLERVIEIHVSGGSESEPAWLPSKRSMRLDGHDGAVPEEVWALLERALPRCPALRGVTLERMEGTVDEGDVPLLEDELARLRRTLEGARVGAR